LRGIDERILILGKCSEWKVHACKHGQASKSLLLVLEKKLFLPMTMAMGAMLHGLIPID
jgi:hypothetical protein